MNENSTTPDCLVVGGGLIGLMSARLLRREGLAVTLLERGEICSESSWAGGGILSPLAPWRYPDAVSELVAWSQSYYPQLAQELLRETGIDVEWQPDGLMMADTVPDPAITAWVKRFGVTLEVLDEAHARAFEPSMRAAAGPALRFPDVAQVRNPRLCMALEKAARLEGVRVLEHTEVTGIDVHGARVHGVHTQQGVMAAGRVVIAGGAWSAQLLDSIGLPLAVTPVRGQMLLYQARPGLLRHVLMEKGHYLIPRRDGLVLAGSTLEYTGFDKSTTPQARDSLSRAAAALVPELARTPITRQWAGLRPGTKDGVPYIGEVPGVEGLFLNTGHFRNGVVLAPSSARVLLDCMLRREGFTDYRPFLPRQRAPEDAPRRR